MSDAHSAESVSGLVGRSASAGAPFAGFDFTGVTPYYEDDSAAIFHGDSMEILPLVERGSVTAVVTDPPYVIGAVSAGYMAASLAGDVLSAADRATDA